MVNLTLYTIHTDPSWVLESQFCCTRDFFSTLHRYPMECPIWTHQVAIFVGNLPEVTEADLTGPVRRLGGWESSQRSQFSEQQDDNLIHIQKKISNSKEGMWTQNINEMIKKNPCNHIDDIYIYMWSYMHIVYPCISICANTCQYFAFGIVDLPSRPAESSEIFHRGATSLAPSSKPPLPIKIRKG